jgi:hypothetical protein
MKHKTIILILSALLDTKQKPFKLTFRHFTSLTTQHWMQNFCEKSLLLIYLLAHFSFDVAPYTWIETKIMFVCTSGNFLTLSLCLGPCLGVPPAGIAEVLDLKGLREGMNRWDTQKDSLRKGMTEHISRQPEGWWPTGKILFFSASFIQKRKRLKHQNTLT